MNKEIDCDFLINKDNGIYKIKVWIRHGIGPAKGIINIEFGIVIEDPHKSLIEIEKEAKAKSLEFLKNAVSVLAND